MTGLGPESREISPYRLLLVDDQGSIPKTNPSAGELFGYPGDDLVGQPAELLIPEAQGRAVVTSVFDLRPRKPLEAQRRQPPAGAPTHTPQARSSRRQEKPHRGFHQGGKRRPKPAVTYRGPGGGDFRMCFGTARAPNG